jgi:PAS domain S-box-containing protein
MTLLDNNEGLIIRRAAAIVTLVGLGAGIAGLAAMRESFDKSAREGFALIAKMNAMSLASDLEVRVTVPKLITTSPFVREALDRSERDANDEDARRRLDTTAADFVKSGGNGVQFYTRSGALISSKGTFAAAPPLFALATGDAHQRANLVWHQGYFLRTDGDVLASGIVSGRVVTEQALPAFDDVIARLRNLSNTADASLCSRSNGLVTCAPDRIHSTPYTILIIDPLRNPKPVERITDRRGVAILNSIVPVGAYGVVLVIKSDEATLDGPLRERATWLIAAFLALVVGGTWVLRGTIRPLLLEIARERDRAQRAEQEARRMASTQASIVRMQHDIAASEAGRQASLERVTEEARRLTGAMGSAIMVGDGDELVTTVVAGPSERLRGFRVPRATSLAGQAMDRNLVMWSEDTENDTRVHREATRAAGARALMYAPIRQDDRAIGVLTLTFERPQVFGEYEVDTLQILAESLSALLERESSAQRLRDSEAQYRLTFAANPMPMWIYDVETLRFLAVNDAAVAKYGYSREEFLGMSVTAIRPPKSLRMLTDRLAELAKRPIGDRWVLAQLSPHNLKDGREIQVEMSSNEIRFGERVARMVLVNDVTDRLRADEALRRSKEDLETRVAERTVDLERARLAAEQASRAKSDFVAMVSHELRTPMNGVIGMIDMLGQTRLDDEQSRALKLARESADVLLSIIDAILDIAKIEAGALVMETGPMSIPDVIHRTLAVVTGVAGKGNVRLSTEIDARIPAALLGDAVRLRHILVNLMGNAIKFTSGRPAAEVKLSARLVDLDAGRARVELVVEDNGIGMDAATLARLYQPFTQADVSTTRRFGGTGLGLAITRQFVELMGGAIEARSTPDVGTVFTVTLSFEVTNVPTAPEWVKAAHPQGTAAVRVPARKPVRPERVLVAEDNEMNQEVVLRQLNMLGFQAEVAANGRAALELWRTGRFALVLADLQMPEMDGYDLATAIRSEEGPDRHTPIVALTANALNKEAVRCMNVGMDDYLTKPTKLSVFEETLNRLLSRETSLS